MPLASKLAFQFERRLQFKGLNLFHANAVRVTDANQSHLYGEVQGGNRYSVRMNYAEGVLSVHCGCIYFDENDRCKHLWAAILEADKRGVLRDALNAPNLRVVREELEPVPPAAEPAPSRSWYSGRPQRTAPWQEYLSDIEQMIALKQTRAAQGGRDYEILYAIDQGASKTANAIVIELFSRSRKKNGEWTVNKEFRVTPNQVSTLRDPLDADALAAILGGQEYYLYSYGSASATTRKALPFALARKLIPGIAAA